MQGIFVGVFMMAGMTAINLLPLQPGWRVLLAAIFGGTVGWGIMRWKARERPDQEKRPWDQDRSCPAGDSLSDQIPEISPKVRGARKEVALVLPTSPELNHFDFSQMLRLGNIFHPCLRRWRRAG